MPLGSKRRYTKKSSSKLVKRRPMRRRPRRVPLPVSGFPKSKMVKLRYSEEILLNAPAGGGPAVYVFSANGMYDPNITSTGHQPRGFDEWMNVYQHYTVVGSSCNARWVPSSATDKVPSAYGVSLTDDATFPHTSLSDIIESVEGGNSWRMAGGIGMATKGKFPSITRRFSAKKFFGTKNVIAEHDYRGNALSNPSEQANYMIWATGCASADPDALCFQVTIDFIAVLTERKGLAQS